MPQDEELDPREQRERQFRRLISNAPRTIGLGVELEGQILALALEDREFFLFCQRMLKPSHFDGEGNGLVWSFLLAYFRESNGVLPSRRILEHAFGQRGINVEPPALEQREKEYVKNRVFAVIRMQKYEEFLVTAMMTSSVPMEEIGEYLERMYGMLRDVVWLKPDVALGTQYFDAAPRWNKIVDYWSNRTSTGFPSLDVCLPGGGLGRKELVCFMGPSGIGKSIWLTNMGANLIKQGHKVLHITREISEEILSMRYDACLLGRTTDELVGNVRLTIEMLEELRARLGLSKELLWIKEFPTHGGSVEDSMAYAAMLRERYGFVPEFVIDDYLDIAKPTRNMKSRYEEQGLTFGEFRGWMVTDNLGGISATQAVRGAEDLKGPAKMKHTADSIDKVRVMDVYMTINETFEDMIAGRQAIFFAKNRNQRSSMYCNFSVDKPRMRITDLNDYYQVGDRPRGDPTDGDDD